MNENRVTVVDDPWSRKKWAVSLDGIEIGTLRTLHPGRSRRDFYNARAHDDCDLGTWPTKDEAAQHVLDDWESGCPRDPRDVRERYRWQFGRAGEEPVYMRRSMQRFGRGMLKRPSRRAIVRLFG